MLHGSTVGKELGAYEETCEVLDPRAGDHHRTRLKLRAGLGRYFIRCVGGLYRHRPKCVGALKRAECGVVNPSQPGTLCSRRSPGM